MLHQKVICNLEHPKHHFTFTNEAFRLVFYKIMRNKTIHLYLEVIIRIILVVTFFKLETVEPFQRKILANDLWNYR